LTRFWEQDDYYNVIGNYNAYIWRGVRNLKKHLPKDANKILSIGAGLGDIERLLGLNITCYDPYSPVIEYRQIPSESFDYSFAYGGVISCALPRERQAILNLALSLSPKFLINTGLQNINGQDECFIYTQWDEKELLKNYEYKRVGRFFLEVTSDTF